MTIREADTTRLDDIDALGALLGDIITLAKCHEIDRLSHTFTPQGVSMIALLEESHLAMHTWPEHGSAYITLTTCDTNQETLDEKLKLLLSEHFSTEAITMSEMRS